MTFIIKCRPLTPCALYSWEAVQLPQWYFDQNIQGKMSTSASIPIGSFSSPLRKASIIFKYLITYFVLNAGQRSSTPQRSDWWGLGRHQARWAVEPASSITSWLTLAWVIVTFAVPSEHDSAEEMRPIKCVQYEKLGGNGARPFLL